MTDTPERIWAWAWEVDVSRGQWALNPSVGFDEEAQYIRADIAEAEKRAAVAAKVQEMASRLWPHDWIPAPNSTTNMMLYAAASNLRALSDTDALAEYVERERAEERERICGIIRALKDEPEIECKDGFEPAFNAGWDGACIEAMIAINAEAEE
jgi:hypothetical protein